MDDYVANFPKDIVNEILLRCPIKSLLRFKCACKNWNALIKTPKFIQQHLKKNRSPLQLLIYNTADVLDDSCPMTLISEENSQTFLGMKYVIGYVDGLFLMEGQINRATCCALWNPATREQSIRVVGTHGEFSKLKISTNHPHLTKRCATHMVLFI
ncbi:hypothetical protein RDI58_011992 [Solanum bulbocastanum]|uniref:F-box domain-containing protein n=1 Tax=Solanum bulbocastanum TaxID=147425 RepID=A0AAN8YI78_SOLBU